jgi:hypothetical protein
MCLPDCTIDGFAPRGLPRGLPLLLPFVFIFEGALPVELPRVVRVELFGPTTAAISNYEEQTPTQKCFNRAF